MSVLRVSGALGSYDVDAVPLKSGGQGSILQVVGADLVYKRYRAPIRDASEVERLGRLAELGRRVQAEAGAPAGESGATSINWPVDVVFAGHEIVGVILSLIPPRFLLPTSVPRDFSFLYLHRAGPPPARVRVPVLIRFAEVLGWLATYGYVHGDVSGKNLVWADAPNPGAYLIDCDGLYLDGVPGNAIKTWYWADPRLLDGIIRRHDMRSDWYALALAMYRGLFLLPGNLDKEAGKWRSPRNIPKAFDAGICDLLHRALDDPLDSSRRPSPEDWSAALRRVFIRGTKYNGFELDELDRLASSSAASRTMAVLSRNVPSLRASAHQLRKQAAVSAVHLKHATRALTMTAVLGLLVVALGLAVYQLIRPAPPARPGPQRASTPTLPMPPPSASETGGVGGPKPRDREHPKQASPSSQPDPQHQRAAAPTTIVDRSARTHRPEAPIRSPRCIDDPFASGCDTSTPGVRRRFRKLD
jgi:hypothetical protein